MRAQTPTAPKLQTAQYGSFATNNRVSHQFGYPVHEPAVRSARGAESGKAGIYAYYAVADSLSRGVYTEWDDVPRLRPKNYKGFHRTTDAKVWLRKQDARFSCYAVTDRSRWRVYFKWSDVAKLSPASYKGFNDEEAAHEWLNEQGDHAATDTTADRGAPPPREVGQQPVGKLRSAGYGSAKITGYRTYRAREKHAGPLTKQKGRYRYYAVASGTRPGIYTDWNAVRQSGT